MAAPNARKAMLDLSVYGAGFFADQVVRSLPRESRKHECLC